MRRVGVVVLCVGLVLGLSACRETKPAPDGAALTTTREGVAGAAKVSKPRVVALPKRPERVLQSADGLTMVLWGEGALQTFDSATGKVRRECPDALRIDGTAIDERVWLVGREHVLMSRGVTMRAVKATTCEVVWTYALKPGDSVSSLLGLTRVEDESWYLWRTEPISPKGLRWLHAQLPALGALGAMDAATLTAEFDPDGGKTTIMGERGEQRWKLRGRYRVFSQEYTEPVLRGRWMRPDGQGVVLLHSYPANKQKTSPLQAVDTATGKTLWTAQLPNSAGSLRWSERAYTVEDATSPTTWVYLVRTEEHDETRTWFALRRDTGAVTATLDTTAPKQNGRSMPSDARGRWLAAVVPALDAQNTTRFDLLVLRAPEQPATP